MKKINLPTLAFIASLKEMYPDARYQESQDIQIEDDCIILINNKKEVQIQLNGAMNVTTVLSNGSLMFSKDFLTHADVLAFLEKEILEECLNHYYETDLDNCTMTAKMWISQLTEALTDKNYLDKFKKEYQDYQNEREHQNERERQDYQKER
jgi:hypothetical protein